MAKEVIKNEVLFDDLDLGEAGEKIPADETIEFAVDGIRYKIDLSTANANEFREVLMPYIKYGTKLTRGKRKTAIEAEATTEEVQELELSRS